MRNPLSGSLLAAAGVLTLLLAGCGGSSEQPAASGEAAEVRIVEHARGETEVPTDPQRIVVLEPVQLDTAVALGRTPVGAAVLNVDAGVPAYLGAAGDDVEVVGTVPEPDLEAIAALQPDLILGTESRHAELYDQLSGVAPTVFMASQADPWRDNVAFVAEALGDPDGADALLADYDARCAEIADEFDTAGSTAQLIRPRDGLLTLYGPTSFAGSTLECAGFTIPDRDWEGSISVDLSPENASEGAADLVVVTSADPTDPTTLPEVLTLNPQLFADAELVDQAFWITGVGPVGGMAVLDDLERLLSAP